MDLSIIIVSYNVRMYLLACLEAVYRQMVDISLEVIVVDNVSGDGSVEAVRAAFPQVKLFANAENIGFARGNNQGVRESSGRYVLFLNPDTEMGRGTLAGLAHFADVHPEASVFTCRLSNSDGSLQHSCFHFPSLRMAFYGFFPLVPTDSVANGRYPREYFDHVFGPEHILGACLMIRREALDAIGGWDDGFFMYFEETDLCYRLQRHGYMSLYSPDFSVVHHGGRSTGAEREKMSVAFYRSQAHFYRRNYGLLRFVALKGVVLFGLLFWTARSCKNYLQRRIDGRLLKTRLVGYWEILRA